ncbi:MAG TPA: hypothetical protein ENK24_07785 [Anaerolineae bacterium]|nr:hypothetical protein [Anaerolineae bacterium]
MRTKEKKKLTIRVDARLLEQAKTYAKTHDTSVSRLVEDYFSKLPKKNNKERSSLVQQLTGILPADVDVEKVYGDYLLEKYG